MRKKGASLVRSLRVIKFVKHLVFEHAWKIIKSTRISHVMAILQSYQKRVDTRID